MVELELIAPEFTVCKIPNAEFVDFGREFVFLSKTDEEVSLVCESGCEPRNAAAAEGGWRALRFAGVLDFALVGVIAGMTGILSGAGICVFVVSTYNTDYVFIKSEDCQRGAALLARSGYTIKNAKP